MKIVYTRDSSRYRQKPQRFKQQRDTKKFPITSVPIRDGLLYGTWRKKYAKKFAFHTVEKKMNE